MSKGWAIAIMSLGTVLLVAAGLVYWGEKPDPELVCTRAADRWTDCATKTVGPGVAHMLESTRENGIPACVEDPMTVEMYEHCLPESECNQFLACLEDYVKQ